MPGKLQTAIDNPDLPSMVIRLYRTVPKPDETNRRGRTAGPNREIFAREKQKVIPAATNSPISENSECRLSHCILLLSY